MTTTKVEFEIDTVKLPGLDEYETRVMMIARQPVPAISGRDADGFAFASAPMVLDRGKYQILHLRGYDSEEQATTEAFSALYRKLSEMME